jgi:tRNA threonylcarbamoyladenosine modification (KEOPS) complex Cgi121 subunit
MLKPMEEYGKYVEISGFKRVDVEDARSFVEGVCLELPADVEVQLFDADLIATWEHLYFAALNAQMAFKNKRNISKSLAVETALYASSQRQIKKGLDFIGVKPESVNVAVLVLGVNADLEQAGLSAIARRLGAEPDESVLELSKAKVERIRSAFGVSDVELETVSSRGNTEQALLNLVIERMALLSTRL